MLVRWLSPVVVLVALLAQSAGFATAGVENLVMCCCPSVEQCKCHEHDEPVAPTQLGRCGGAVEQVAPVAPAMLVPEAPAPVIAVERAIAVEHVLPIPSDADPLPPEKPPF